MLKEDIKKAVHLEYRIDKKKDNCEHGYPSFYSCSRNASSALYCSEFNLEEAVNSADCFSVRWIAWSSFSRKNCETVIPKASHIFTREGIVGSICLRYQEEIVDCVSPECSASWYSVQWCDSLNSVIRSSRSEERRVGKECLRLCRSRWSPYH